jgi:speckle-type POZ protein
VDGWGRDKFMLNTMLKDNTLGYRVDDRVIFKVEISVYGELEYTPILDSDQGTRMVNTLEVSLRNMFNDPVTSDVVIISGMRKDRVHAHKCILASRSDVFRAMFTGQFREHSSLEVTIPDIEASVMKEVLYHMYTDNIPDKSYLAENAAPLLLAALKYQLPYLIESIETYLVSQLEYETATAMLIFAENVGCQSLKKKVMLYIAQNSAKILQLKEFQELDGDLLSEANTMIDFVNKKRGCRGTVDKERKVNFGCNIM